MLLLQMVTNIIRLLKERTTTYKPTIVKLVQRELLDMAALARDALGLPLWRSKVNVLVKK